MTLWHGGRGLHQSYHEMRPSAKGQWEYGPGLYLTNRYETAVKYAKGGGNVYLVTITKGTEINSVDVSLEDATDFVKRYVIKRLQRQILGDLKNCFDKRGKLPIVTVVNLCLNHQAITTRNTLALRQYVVDHGVDYEVSRGYGGRGDETLVIVYNPACIKNVQKISTAAKYYTTPSNEIS